MPTRSSPEPVPPADQWRPALQQHLRLLQVIILGMTAGPAVLLVFAILIRRIVDFSAPAALTWLAWAIVPVTLVGAAGAFWWERILVERNLRAIVRGNWKLVQIPSGSQLQSDFSAFVKQFGDVGRLWVTFSVARMAKSGVLEGLACLVTLGYIIAGGPLFVVLAAVLIGATLSGFPTLDSTAGWISHALRRIEQERASREPQVGPSPPRG